MKKATLSAGIFLLSLFFTLSLVATAAAEYRIGVLAKRGKEKAFQKWNPTAAYLSEQLGKPFVIVPLSFERIEPAVKGQTIDFLLANSAFYAEMKEKYGVKAISTLINEKKGLAMYEFGGVVFTRNDSPIHELKQIKGHRFMCVKFSSFGGAHMAQRLLLENGINPHKDCTAFLEGGTHDKVVLAVRDGRADAGTVRSDTLERMQDEGKISMSDYRIIHRVEDTFPFVHSTRLYPEWPLAACVGTDPQVSRQVAKALMLMPGDSPALRAAKINGWTYPADYTSVADCLRKIGYGAFAQK